MPNIDELHAAAETADLATIQRLVEQEAVDLNALHSVHQTRAIDFAAQAGHLEIVEYLYTQGASLDAVYTGANNSLLYWICRCENATRRLALLNWLRADDRYLQLNDGITLAHLAAAAGEAFENTADLHDNLCPVYYAVMVNNPHLTVELLLPHLNSVVQAGHNRGLTLAWHLAYFTHWQLLQACLARSAELIDLSASPLQDNHSEKGTTLAWLLAGSDQWQLLETCIRNSVEPIHLNAAPLHDNHSEKGTTLAWLLAYYDQWQLLETCIRNSVEPIDLNAAPLADNHPGKGITLAWLLADKYQWEFLETFIKNSVEPIHLNAAPLHENHIDKGITLGLLLTYSEQFDLLEMCIENSFEPINLNATPLHEDNTLRGMTIAWKLVSVGMPQLLQTYIAESAGPIDLNAAPVDDKDPDKGFTLAWQLAANKEWELLQTCATNSIKPTDLNATPLGEDSDYEGITLVSWLVTKKQWDLIKIFLKKYCECEPDTFHIRFEEIINKHPEQQKLIELIQLVAIEYKYRLLMGMLNQNHISLADTQTEIASLMTEIKQLTEDSGYYPAAQSIKGHLLLTLAAQAALAASVVTINIVRNEIAAATKMHPLTSAENQLKLLAINALINAKENILVTQLMAEIFAKSEALELQNLKAQSDATKSSSKRQKIDSENSETFISSNTQQSMASTNFFQSSGAVDPNQMEVAQGNTAFTPTYN